MSVYISREHRFQILIRTIAVSALLISLLQGTLFILDFNRSMQNVVFICIALLTLITAWKCLQNFKSHLMTLVVILLLCQLGIFVFNLIRTVPPFPFRLLQVAILLLYLSLLISALLILSWRINPTKIYLLIFSIALGCFIGETMLGLLNHYTKRNLPSGPIWNFSAESHPILGYTYSPYSVGKIFYPDDPRGYFEKEDSPLIYWSLNVSKGDKANLIHYPDKPDIFRIEIKAVESHIPPYIGLKQEEFVVRSNMPYALKFRAQADSPRQITVSVSNMVKNLGLYRTIELTNKWQTFYLRFIAKADDRDASINFNLGGSVVPVEFSNVRLKSLSDGQTIRPRPHTYYISYKFNAFGCRGRDYAIPKRNGTVRILLLGDSLTMGVGVREEDTFASQLESILNMDRESSSSKTDFEVINCGIAGYGTEEERLFYELNVKKYEPDVILLVIFWNDDMSWKEEIDKGYVNRIPGKFESLIFLWGVIQEYRYKKPSPNFSRSIKEILKLNKEASRNNARLVVVFFRDIPDDLDSRTLGRAWKNLINTVTEGLADTDIPVLDLGKAFFREHAEWELRVHKIDGHLNEVAHGIAARELFSFLQAKDLLKSQEK